MYLHHMVFVTGNVGILMIKNRGPFCDQEQSTISVNLRGQIFKLFEPFYPRTQVFENTASPSSVSVAEDEQFESDKAQVVRVIAALELKDKDRT